MKKVLLTAAAMGVSASAAMGGGVERSNQSVGVLFEEGRYLEFGVSAGSPDVSGSISSLNSDDMTDSFINFGAAYKADINEQLSYAFILNQPYGASVNYPSNDYLFAGSNAELESTALTGILKYTTPSNFSVYGGLRLQSLEANADVITLTGLNYTGTVDRGVELGYLAGVAYERPDIALRVSLTYNSAIDYDLDTIETQPGVTSDEGVPSTTPITTPQSLHLEFQTGVAEDTLVFGGIRWVEWTEFEIDPQIYNLATSGSKLVSFQDDRTTFTLGLGRRLNEQWSVAGSISYEESTGSLTGNLGPTDGFLGATLAAIYTMDNTEITAGVSYVDIGDATTNVNGAPGAEFTDNSAVGFGLKVGYSF